MSHFILLISTSTDHFYDMYLVMVSPLQQPRRVLSNDGVLPSISSTLISSEAVQPSVVKNSKGSCSKAFRLTISTPQSILGSLFTHDEISSPVPFFCDGVHCFENATPPELLPSRADVVSPIHPILLLCINPKTVSLCSCVYLLPETSKGPGRTRKEAL